MAFFGFPKQPVKQANNPKSNPKSNNNANADDDPTKSEPKGLDKFAHLFNNANTPKEGDTNTNTKQPLDVSTLFKDENFLSGLRSNIRSNVNSAISEETRQKLQNNDPEALMSLVSDVAEATYMQALQHGASMQNLVLQDRIEELNTNTGKFVDSKLRDQEFIQAIPQIKNPIVRLGVDSFMTKIREQNPSISPEEMNMQLKDYLSELGKDFGIVKDPQEQDLTDDTSKGIDWFAELGIDAPPDGTDQS